MASPSLRERQIVSLTQMLNLNESKSNSSPSSSSSSSTSPKEPVWKILIYDRVGMDILTPLFTVQELRQNGITLHIPLHSPERILSPIPDVPSIYFALPTEDNIDRISRDIQSNLYGNYFLNFLRPIPRSRIEDLATAVLSSPDSKCVSKVFDQYVDFVCLENELFVLNCKQGIPDFHALNRPNLTDSEMNEMIDNIVDSLFSVCVTYGQVPIIRTPKANAAELIGEKLDKKIRDNIRDHRSSLFNSNSNNSDYGPMSTAGGHSSSRPLLIIYDRGMDLATPLAHPWTYQSLTHDILENTQNQIKFSEEDSSKIFSVDTRRDGFWKTHKGSPFPTVAEAIQNELEDYRKSEEEVKKLKQTMGLMGEDQQNLMDFDSIDVSDNTAKLTNAIKDLPQLIERKRVLDAHTSIATAILSEIKSRHLDTYYESESKLLAKSESVSINNILLDGKIGKFEDKMRLYLIYYLANSTNNQVSNSELDQFAASLASVASSEQEQELLKALDFVKKWISYSKMAATVPSSSTSSSLPSSMMRQQGSMLTKLVNTGSNFLMEGVRNLVFKRQTLPVTRVALDLCEGRDLEDYRTFDPKQLSKTRQNQNQVYNDCIVFVVGGGNYIEYQNLMDCFNKNNNSSSSNNLSALAGQQQTQNSRKVTYGATCLYNGEEFLQQLAMLGKE